MIRIAETIICAQTMIVIACSLYLGRTAQTFRKDPNKKPHPSKPLSPNVNAKEIPPRAKTI